MSGPKHRRERDARKLEQLWKNLMTLHVRRGRKAPRARAPTTRLAILAAAALAALRRPLAQLARLRRAASRTGEWLRPQLIAKLAPRPPLVALVFAAGIALAQLLGVPFAVSALALTALAATLRATWLPRALRLRLTTLLAVLALGAGAQLLRGVAPPEDDPLDDEASAPLPEDIAREREHRGVVTRPAIQRAPGRFELEVALEPEGRAVRVLAPRAAVPGDEVALVGRLRPPRGTRNPGSLDRAASARADGIELELSAESIERIGRDRSPWLAIWRGLGALRDRWTAKIQARPAAPSQAQIDEKTDETADASRAPAPLASRGASAAPLASPPPLATARAVLTGVLLGVRADIPPSLDERWRAVGIYHVLSVSGLHLAVVALLVFTALRRLAAAVGTRAEPAAVALVPALLVATAYTLLTGAQVATLRALLVAALWMLGRAVGRPLRLLDALAVTAIALLAWSPAQLWQPSFQLSFAAALGLALHRGARHDPGQRLLRRIVLRLVASLARSATTSAWIALITAPITAYHFHQVQPGGVLGNLLLTPLLELAALPLGLAGLVVGELSSAAGAALVTAAAAIVAAADALAALLQPWCPVGAVAIASPAIAALLWAGTTALCGRPRRGALDAAAWCGLCALWLAAPLPPPEGVRVVFLDVGQGDAALIETASELWLVDAGGAPGATSLEAASAPGRAIPRYLELSRRRHIDVAVISHPHPDHYLGLLALAGEVTIGELWLPPGFVDAREQASTYGAATPSFHAVVEQLRRAGTVVRAPPPEGRRSREGAQLTLVAPRYREHAQGPEHLAADPIRSVNDNSAVVLLDYANRRVLLPGDLELEGEEALIAALPPHLLRADVIKVPHHGSRTSSTQGFVDAVLPAGADARAAAPLAIVSCGAGNRFGFPAAEVVARWRSAGARVLRTDRGGAVIVEVAPDGSLAARRR